MERLLNVVAAAQSKNHYYDVCINNFEEEGWDFYLTFEREFDRGSSASYEFDRVLEALSDFSDFKVSSYVYGEDYAPEARDKHGRHVVEVMVEK